MTRIVTFPLLVFVPLMLSAQPFQWTWSQRHTTGVVETVEGHCNDAAGNTYLTGYFYGTLAIGNLPALTSNGEGDFYVAKFSPEGAPLWSRSGGGAGEEAMLGIAVDDDGHVSVCGYFGSTSITIGGTTLVRQGTFDIMVAQYDGDGTPRWARRYGYTNSALEWGEAIVADANGDLYVSGHFRSGFLVDGLPDLVACAGGDQGFLLKLDGEGNGLWSLMPQCSLDGALGRTRCTALAVDPAGNVFLGGEWRGEEAVFSTDTLVNVNPSGQSPEGFLAKYTSGGEELWVRPISGTNIDEVNGLATDSEGNCYLTGRREGPYLIDGIDLPISGSLGFYRITLWKFDPDGTALWGRRAGNTSFDHNVLAIAVDAQDRVYIGGVYQRGATFDDIVFPDSPQAEFYGLYIAQYDADGTVQQVYTRRDDGPRVVVGLGTDANSNLYVSGGFSDTLTFPPLAQLQGGGFFLAKSGDVGSGFQGVSATDAAGVYPNPVRDVLNMQVAEGTRSFTVINARGSIVRSERISERAIQVDLSDLPQGLYMVRQEGAYGSTTQRFVKQ